MTRSFCLMLYNSVGLDEQKAIGMSFVFGWEEQALPARSLAGCEAKSYVIFGEHRALVSHGLVRVLEVLFAALGKYFVKRRPLEGGLAQKRPLDVRFQIVVKLRVGVVGRAVQGAPADEADDRIVGASCQMIRHLGAQALDGAAQRTFHFKSRAHHEMVVNVGVDPKMAMPTDFSIARSWRRQERIVWDEGGGRLC